MHVAPFALAVLLVAASAAGAQQQDSARAGVTARRRPVPTDTARPPISPRRAFFASLLLPGYAQTRLERGTAASIFVTAEVLGLAMAVKSKRDLLEARLHTGDTVVVAFQPDPTRGTTIQDPLTGQLITPACPRGTTGPFFRPADSTFFIGRISCASRYTADRVRARRTHYEDWIAFLVFNHLFAGADAFVAAQLWDLPTRVSIRPSGRGAVVAASVAW